METNLMQLDELFHLENQIQELFSADSGVYRRGIYELIIRTVLSEGQLSVNQLTKASSLVKRSQSAIMEVIEEKLNEEEHNIYRQRP